MKSFFSRLAAKIRDSRLRHTITRLRLATDHAEDSLLAILFRWRFVLFAVAVTVLAFVGRVSLWPIVSADYNECLHIWLNEIRQGQGFRSVGTQIGNYTAPYHYLMAAMTYIPGLSNLDIIKITSTVADFCMAGAAAAVCWQLTKAKWKALACYALLLCLPTVFLNSAAWGQCDAMFTCFILLFLAFYLNQKKSAALFFYGIALAVKLQAIFILPAILIFWICGRLRLRQMLMGVLSYVLLFIPAMACAGSLAPLFRAYAMQTKIHSLASNIYNGASLFIGIDAEMLGYLSGMLLCGTFIAIGAIALYCWKNKSRMTPSIEFLLVALMAVTVPFLLPAMKDRYYYVIEVLAVMYALAWPRRLLAPVLMQLASLPSYMAYLTGAQMPFGPWPVLFVGAVPLLLIWDLRRLFNTRPSTHSFTGVPS